LQGGDDGNGSSAEEGVAAAETSVLDSLFGSEEQSAKE
jgi:hypothetical protein